MDRKEDTALDLANAAAIARNILEKLGQAGTGPYRNLVNALQAFDDARQWG